MTSREYEKLCKSAHSGIQVFVENEKTRLTGRVLACEDDAFLVEVAGQRQAWPREECREQSYHTPHYSD